MYIFKYYFILLNHNPQEVSKTYIFVAGAHKFGLSFDTTPTSISLGLKSAEKIVDKQLIAN